MLQVKRKRAGILNLPRIRTGQVVLGRFELGDDIKDIPGRGTRLRIHAQTRFHQISNLSWTLCWDLHMGCSKLLVLAPHLMRALQRSCTDYISLQVLLLPKCGQKADSDNTLRTRLL